MNIIGCDFHSRSQQIAMLDSETGELVRKRLDHESGEARSFYEGLKEPALVGIESMGYARWFAEMLAGLGHELVAGEAAKIRASETRKQKHDRRDAEHILNLLVKGDFPKIWLPPAEERDVRVWIEHRHQLVELRTRAQNGLQAVALSYGLRRRHRLWSRAGQKELAALPLREGTARRRQDLVALVRQLSGHLTKQGNRLMRFLLVEAAGIASRYDVGLRRTYRRLVFRKGAPIAKVAVARKLAIRL
jgi:transposase